MGLNVKLEISPYFRLICIDANLIRITEHNQAFFDLSRSFFIQQAIPAANMVCQTSQRDNKLYIGLVHFLIYYFHYDCDSLDVRVWKGITNSRCWAACLWKMSKEELEMLTLLMNSPLNIYPVSLYQTNSRWTRCFGLFPRRFRSTDENPESRFSFVERNLWRNNCRPRQQFPQNFVPFHLIASVIIRN